MNRLLSEILLSSGMGGEMSGVVPGGTVARSCDVKRSGRAGQPLGRGLFSWPAVSAGGGPFPTISPIGCGRSRFGRRVGQVLRRDRPPAQPAAGRHHAPVLHHQDRDSAGSPIARAEGGQLHVPLHPRLRLGRCGPDDTATPTPPRHRRSPGHNAEPTDCDTIQLVAAGLNHRAMVMAHIGHYLPTICPLSALKRPVRRRYSEALKPTQWRRRYVRHRSPTARCHQPRSCR